MKEIDKTKQNIKVNQLDDSQRKKLYQKFVDSGGQVLNEKQVRRNMVIDREKQKEHQKRMDEHFTRVKTSTGTKTTSASRSKSASTTLTPHVPFSNFRIRMRLFFHGVTGLNTFFYKNRFLKNMNLRYKPALMEIQNTYLALFRQNPKRGNQIIMRLDKISPLYYELIEKAGEVYDPIDLRDLADNFSNYPDVPRQLFELKDPFIQLFRSLYIIKPYENTLYSSFEKAIDLNQHVDENNTPSTLKKKDIRNALYIVFYNLYPCLHTLFCKYNSVLFEETDPRIDEILEILPSEKPGNRIRYDLSRKKSLEEEETELPAVNEDPKKPDIDPSVTEGLRNMYKLDFNILRKNYDKKGVYSILSDNDKVLLTYLLYLEFENEYSFILTTNRIKYKTEYLGTGAVDYKMQMQELFNNMRKVETAFSAYHNEFINFDKVKSQKPINNDQYISYSKRVDELSSKKDIAGSNAKMVIKTFMEKTAAELDVLSKDMDDKQMHVANPQDVIDMNPEIEGNKKIHGMKVFEAIKVVRNYAAAFAYRLGPDGDLYGKQEYSENKSAQKGSDKLTESPSPALSQSNSILDELDDII